MNVPVIIGSVLFILWAALSNWWYVCNIKNLCEASGEAVVASAEPESKAVANPPSDTTANTVESKVKVDSVDTAVQPIRILEKGILFIKSSTEYSDPSAAQDLFRKMLSDIGDQPVEIQITGHTCDQGNNTYNTELGLRRARRVGADLESIGFTMDNVKYASSGEREPLVGNESEEQRNLNRRVELLIQTK